MDSNNFNIFGPYANKFISKNQETQPKSTAKSTVKSVRSQRKPAQQQQTAIASAVPTIKKALFTSSPSTSKSNLRTTAKQPPDWTSFHKQPSVNFALPFHSKLGNRMNQAEERRKTKRTEVVTENRNIDIKSLNLTPAPTSKSKAAATMSKSAVTANESSIGSEISGPPIKESRKEQLLRWKREKDELAKNGPQKKPPFKSGPAAPLITRPQTKTNAAAVHTKPADMRNEPPERRVTRAMAKAQVYPLSSAFGGNRIESTRAKPVPRDNKPGNLRKPAAQDKVKSKTTLNGKEQLQVFPTECAEEPMVVDVSEADKSLAKKDRNQKAPKAAAAAMHAPPAPAEEKVPPPVPHVNGTEQTEPARPKTRKPKGMQFDATYIEYNDNFVKACSALLACSTKWSEKFSASREKIPEDICCDIESTLGQAKLLMESKLPQFGELLYFYLSKHPDPGPILPGDLQGWWDVAIISVDKVLQRFEKLDIIEKNGWVEEVMEVQSNQNVNSSSEPLPHKLKPVTALPGSGSKSKINAKANSGLMAFLAEKRRKAAENKEKVEKADTPLKEKELNFADKSPSPDRKFEGGFFEIHSPKGFVTPQKPMRTPRATRSSVNLLSSALQTNLQLTPGPAGSGRLNQSLNTSALRRLSNPRTPLMMLAVRRSMGNLSKLGAKGDTPAKAAQNGNIEGSSPAFANLPEETPM